jgi:hypothetical protein
MYNILFIGKASVFVMPLFCVFSDTIGQDPLQKGSDVYLDHLFVDFLHLVTPWVWSLDMITTQ